MASIISSARSIVTSAASVIENGANTFTGVFALASDEVESFRTERDKNRKVASHLNDMENAQVLREGIVNDEKHAIKCAEELAAIEDKKTDLVKAKLSAMEAVMQAKFNL